MRFWLTRSNDGVIFWWCAHPKINWFGKCFRGAFQCYILSDGRTNQLILDHHHRRNCANKIERKKRGWKENLSDAENHRFLNKVVGWRETKAKAGTNTVYEWVWFNWISLERKKVLKDFWILISTNLTTQVKEERRIQFHRFSLSLLLSFSHHCIKMISLSLWLHRFWGRCMFAFNFADEKHFVCSTSLGKSHTHAHKTGQNASMWAKSDVNEQQNGNVAKAFGMHRHNVVVHTDFWHCWTTSTVHSIVLTYAVGNTAQWNFWFINSRMHMNVSHEMWMKMIISRSLIMQQSAVCTENILRRIRFHEKTEAQMSTAYTRHIQLSRQPTGKTKPTERDTSSISSNKLTRTCTPYGPDAVKNAP